MREKGKIVITGGGGKPFPGILDGFWLKAAMLVLMVFDHVYYYFGNPASLFFTHVLARLVAPVFAFLMAQGMLYTRSRKRYILRLFFFAAVMSFGSMILIFITKINIPNNIFLPLALGASMICFIDKAREGENRPLYITLTVTAAVLSLYSEGQYLVPMMSVIFYYLRGHKPVMYLVYALSAGLPFLLMYALTGTLETQFYMVFAILPIMLYNGRRGYSGAFAKYLFYIFYPLHIWIIVLGSIR